MWFYDLLGELGSFLSWWFRLKLGRINTAAILLLILSMCASFQFFLDETGDNRQATISNQ